MRYLERRANRTEEEESVFVTMTDMTVSFLFIIMILLAFFAAQIGDEDTVPSSKYEQLQEENEKLRAEIEKLRKPNPLEEYLSAAIARQREVIEKIRDRLLVEFPNLQVVISPEQDALRFQGEGLFETDSSELDGEGLRIVQAMGRILDEILVCYTIGDRAHRGVGCDSGDVLIEAVQIEGHTDNDGEDLYNLNLSTNRAIATFVEMSRVTPGVVDHLNLRDQPVLSVSGYGEMRPIASNNTVEGKSANRRIDLRIIIYAPKKIEDLENLKGELAPLRPSGDEK